MRCLSGVFPVAKDVHRIGETVGIKVSNGLAIPFSINFSTFGKSPCFTNGYATCQLKPSKPRRKSFGFSTLAGLSHKVKHNSTTRMIKKLRYLSPFIFYPYLYDSSEGLCGQELCLHNCWYFDNCNLNSTGHGKPESVCSQRPVDKEGAMKHPFCDGFCL